MATKAQAQTALDEQIIEDRELEGVLEDREKAKGAAGEARKKYGTLDELAKGKIGDLDLKDGDAVRIGRFRVSKKSVASRSVSFETSPTERVTISLNGDES